MWSPPPVSPSGACRWPWAAAGPTAPADNDANWTDIVSLDAASALRQEIELPLWIRVNVTTAGTGTATLSLEGVQ